MLSIEAANDYTISRMNAYPSNARAPRPVSCEGRSNGLLFTFSDGSTKFIPKFIPPWETPQSEPVEDERKRA